MLGKVCIRFSEYIEWACYIQCLRTFEYDNGDFHAVTFIE
jgi:hypothetical protein